MSSEEEWSVIELGDKEPPPPPSAEKAKHRTPIQSFISSAASWTGKGGKKDSSSSKASNGPLGSVDINSMDPSRASMENPFWARDRHRDKSSILMPEGSPLRPVKTDKGWRKTAFQDLFRREKRDEDENRDPLMAEPEEQKPVKPAKKQWGLRWKRGGNEDKSTTPALPPGDRSDDASSVACAVVPSPIGEGPDTKSIKKKMHSDGSASGFIIDKV